MKIDSVKNIYIYLKKSQNSRVFRILLNANINTHLYVPGHCIYAHKRIISGRCGSLAQSIVFGTETNVIATGSSCSPTASNTCTLYMYIYPYNII